MLNLLDKKQENKSLKQKKLKISDIEKYYLSNQNNSLIGLEYERLSLDKNTFKNASYELLEKIIKHFCDITSWNLIYDDKTIIGAKSDSGSSISLEPGCQLEISLSPKKEILFIDYEANKIVNLLDKIASAYDVIFLGYGISPITCVDDITLLNKRRYQLMNKFLPKRHYGELSQRMMRQSAGIQINIDYKDKKDAYLKLKFFNLISPFMMGLCANSPFENNVLTDKYSNRAHIWRYTGKERCNFFYKKIFSSPFRVRNIFKNYINSILDVPMIFIERDNKLIPLEGKITFRDFMNSGYLDYQATMDDYITHSSLCFPDVRLKNYIEIRNHDSQDIKMALALCAFYKGLSNSDIKKSLSKIKFLKLDDIEKYNKEIISSGLDYKINNKIDAWSVLAILFNISKANLNTNERSYLEPILKILKLRKTNADLLFDADIKEAGDIIDVLY